MGRPRLVFGKAFEPLSLWRTCELRSGTQAQLIFSVDFDSLTERPCDSSDPSASSRPGDLCLTHDGASEPRHWMGNCSFAFLCVMLGLRKPPWNFVVCPG